MIQILPLILLSVILNTIAQIALKAGMDKVGQFKYCWSNVVPIFTQIACNPYIIGALFIYGFAVVVWMLVLSRVEVSIAYPMISLGYITTALAAYYYFDEPLSVTRIAGIVVIILGVYLVARA